MSKGGRAWIAALLAVLGGLLLHRHGLAVFGRTELVFGNVFALVIAWLSGPLMGGVVALIAGSMTWIEWGHPVGMIFMGMQAMATGWLVQRRGFHPFPATVAFLCVASPLVAAWFLVAEDFTFPGSAAIALKYPLNAILDTIAALALVAIPGVRRLGGTTAPWEVGGRRLGVLLASRFLALVAVPLLALVLLSGRAFDQWSRDRSESDLRRAAGQVADHLDAFLHAHLEAITQVSRLAVGIPADDPRLVRLLEATRSESSAFLTLLVAASDGRIAATSPPLDIPGSSALSVADRDYFVYPMETGLPFVGGAFRGRGFGDDPIVAISARIPGSSGGSGMPTVVEGSLDLSKLRRQLLSLEGVQGRTVVVADARGLVIAASPSTGLVALDSLEGGPWWESFPATHGPLHLNDREASPGGRLERHQGASATVQRSGWRVIVEEPIWNAQRPVASYYGFGFAAVLGASLLTVGLARYTVREFTAPFAVVTRRVKDLASGRAPAGPALLAEQPIEIEELARDLDSAARSLAEALAQRDASNQELERLTRELEDRVRRRTSQLLEAREAAERANQAKGEFLAVMNHEMRTPLNGIIMAASLIPEEKDPLERELLVSTVRLSGELLLALVNNVLDFAKIESGRVETTSEPFAVGEFVRSCIRVVEPLARAKGLTFETRIEGDAGRVVVGDRIHLQQILVNLLGNAVKFTERGGITVVVQIPGESRGLLVVEVIDTGVGIPATRMAELFQPFVQLDASATRRHGGTGLGLAISRRLAELLGGKVLATSKPGDGSTFRLEVPVTLAEPGARGEATPGGDRPTAKLDVLVVEDDTVNQRVIERLLQRLGHEVRIAPDVARADREILERMPDVILVDMQMPGEDGLTAVARWRSVVGMTAKVAILTADARDEVRRQAIEAGCDGFLTKPIERTLIEEFLARAVPRRG